MQKETAVAPTREQQLEQRVGQLEDVVAQLIRSTSAAVAQFASGNFGQCGGGTALDVWRRTGAAHEDIIGLHAHLQRQPAPGQD
jgi:hypothetical protein